MKNGWLIFTGLMSLASVSVIAAYSFLEIKGISMGWKNWAMISFGTFIWILLFMQSYKKGPNG